MKTSINKQFIFVFGSVLAGMLLLCWLANSLLLGKFYITHKQNVLSAAYSQIDKANSSKDITDQKFGVTFEQIASKNSLEILILDSDTHAVRSTLNDSQTLTKRLLSYFIRGTDAAEILKTTDKYHIQKIYDQYLKMEYLELWGLLSNGDMIVMRCPMESIQESVSIANKLLAYVGVIVIMLGAVLVTIVSRRITKPILRLSEISEKMSNLDFDAKYIDDGGQNEISLLGQHMNELSQKLEKTISELKTANNELQHDIEKKNEIDDMRREFLSNVSHELKTPIAIVQGYAEGLKDCVNDDDESRDYYCDVIIDEAQKMNTLVKNLLQLNELEFGKDELVMERFDLAELISNCIKSNEILLKQGGITLSFQKPSPVYVWADEFKVEQVFQNYLSNAIHYALYDKRIDITIEKREQTVRVNVFNTGNPIPDEALDRLWVKFYKVDKARTREYGGSGIGLSIVKAIMESLHQQYGVKNYDNGVTFWFELDGK